MKDQPEQRKSEKNMKYVWRPDSQGFDWKETKHGREKKDSAMNCLVCLDEVLLNTNGRANIVEMLIFSNLICIFNVMTIKKKSPKDFCRKRHKMVLEFIWKHKHVREELENRKLQ